MAVFSQINLAVSMSWNPSVSRRLSGHEKVQPLTVLVRVPLNPLISVGREGPWRLPSLLLPDGSLDPQADLAQLTPLGVCERLED